MSQREKVCTSGFLDLHYIGMRCRNSTVLTEGLHCHHHNQLHIEDYMNRRSQESSCLQYSLLKQQKVGYTQRLIYWLMSSYDSFQTT